MVRIFLIRTLASQEKSQYQQTGSHEIKNFYRAKETEQSEEISYRKGKTSLAVLFPTQDWYLERGKNPRNHEN